ncbi:hypothetical protein Cni_G25795 [Canna indica]|uniref:RNase H type-1 domain-containing protein n=1 Tax=Canna indica TaxID=4628 RepID=A0AAQ3KXS9_9LILI|nr:hypothetical protein Cni_G25795 [Canna indica]
MLKAKALGIKNIRVLTDCQVAVNILDKKVHSPWFLYCLVADIQKLGKEIKCDWLHINREMNVKAHLLAKAGLQYSASEILVSVAANQSTSTYISSIQGDPEDSLKDGVDPVCKSVNNEVSVEMNSNRDISVKVVFVRILDDFNKKSDSREGIYCHLTVGKKYTAVGPLYPYPFS